MATAQRLTIARQSIDVGKTGYESPVTATFELRNKGSKPLIISNLRTDCGCSKAHASKNTIGPGDRFSVQLTYDARQLGHFTKHVAIYSNATERPVMLRMSGVVVSDFIDYSQQYPFDMMGLLTNTNNIEFDDVRKGTHPEVEIGVVNNTEVEMTPNLLHLPSYLTAIAIPENLRPGHKGKIVLTLNSERVGSYGLTQSTIYLARKLGDRISHDTELPVSVVLLPDTLAIEGNPLGQAPLLELSADSLSLDGRHKSGTITLTNNGQSPLKITSLQMFTRGMKVRLPKSELQAGEQTRLKISIDPVQLRKARSKPRVLMITNDPKHTKVVIKVNTP